MNFKTLFLLSFCAACATNAANIDLFFKRDTGKVNMDLVNITNLIIENIFLKRFPEVNFINAVRNTKDPYFVDFKDALLKVANNFTVHRIFNQKFTHWSPLEKIVNVVVTLDNFTSMKPLLDTLSSATMDLSGYFLFVLLNETQLTQDYVLQQMWRKRTLNNNVMYSANERTVIIKTFHPFHKGSCSGGTPLVVATVTDGVFEGNWKDLYPVKMKKLYGCPVRVTIPNVSPSASLLKIRGKMAITGYDVAILNIMSQNLDFNLRFIVANNLSYNESGEETLKLLNDNRADMALHSIGLTKAMMMDFDQTMVYLTMPLVFLVPSGELYGFFEKILQPFEAVVWVFLLSTLLTALAVLFLLDWKLESIRPFFHEDGTGNPTMNFLAAILGLGQSNLPNRNSPRIILMTFLVFCLILRNVYQGVLFDLMQSDGRHTEVRTIQELVDKNYTIFMGEAEASVAKNFPDIYDR